MKEKKNIERLFQEKFKNFEATPPLDAWENINKKLAPEKTNKKVLPLWFKFSGIAAVFLLGFFMLNNNFSEDKIEFTDKENPDNIYQNNTYPDSPIKQNKETIKFESESITENPKIENISNEDTPSIVSKKESIAPKIKETNTTKNNIEITSIENTSFTEDNQETNTVAKNKKSIEDKKLVNSSDLIQKHKTNKEDIKNQNHQTKDNLVANTDKINKSSDLNLNSERSNNKSEKNNSTQPESQIASEFNTKLNTKTGDTLTVDNHDLAQTETNPLQEIMDKKDSEKEFDNKEVLENKWRITPNIAPITMNSFTEGSSVSDSFIENSKDSQTTLSYGLGFSYAFNKKLNIRTGINKVSIGYNTNDVEIYAATDTKDILSNPVNINFNGSSTNIVVKPDNAFNTQNSSSANTGKINQQIGYIEVPVELSFKLIDSRFGVELIGGMSTLFLNENEIFVISQGMSTLLGEADNLNNVHFSTNLGIGFKYEIFKSFEASLEPMFKYQLGTFNKNDGNFKPYILGLYTGLSFKF